MLYDIFNFFLFKKNFFFHSKKSLDSSRGTKFGNLPCLDQNISEIELLAGNSFDLVVSFCLFYKLKIFWLGLINFYSVKFDHFEKKLCNFSTLAQALDVL